MRTPRFSNILLSAIALLALSTPLFFVGCRQGEGERCQIDSDCQDPLYCELQGRDPSQGGTCRMSTNTDAGVTADLTSGPDLTATPDLQSGDAGAGDGGASDAGDGGASDGGRD